jgi:hypothetical protein
MHYFPPALHVSVVFACPDVQTFLASGLVATPVRELTASGGLSPHPTPTPMSDFQRKLGMGGLHLKQLFWLNSLS